MMLFRKSLELPLLLIFLYEISSDYIDKLLGVVSPSGFRHLFLILSLFLLSFYVSYPFKRIDKSLLNLKILFIFYSVTISLQFNVPIINGLIGIIFTILFVYVFFLCFGLDISLNTYLNLLKYLLIYIIFTVFWVLIEYYFSNYDVLRYNFGPYREVGAFATFMVIAVAICLCLLTRFEKNKYLLYVLVFFLTSIIFITTLKKSIINVLFVWAYYFLFVRKIKILSKELLFSFVFLSLLFIVISNQLILNIEENLTYYDNVGASDHVRIGMYIVSFLINIDTLGFGSGPGTFGSLMSIFDIYSPIYYLYGVDMIGENSAEAVSIGHHTLLDTFWPHIIGEYGLIGTLLYLLMVGKLLIFSPKISNDLYEKNRDLVFLSNSVLIIIFLDGLNLYTPEIPQFILVFASFSAFTKSILNNNFNR